MILRDMQMPRRLGILARRTLGHVLREKLLVEEEGSVGLLELSCSPPQGKETRQLISGLPMT